MTFPRRMAAITGVYTTVQGKKLGRTLIMAGHPDHGRAP